MPTTREKSNALTCTHCGKASLLPENRNHSSLWDRGWRWKGAPGRAGIAKFVPDTFVFSCPDCPSVI